MYVRKANEADFTAITNIYAHARNFMRETGNPTQWKSTYPTDDIILNDIKNGSLHILEDADGMQGVFVLLPEGDPIYRNIEGKWLNDEAHAAVHRVASAGKKKGIIAVCMRYVLSLFPNVKIDTHHDNKIMQHQLEKAGFLPCGIVTLANGEKRIAYQYHK